MTKYSAILIVVMITGCSTINRASLVASTATLVCDWADTRFRPTGSIESNPAMGPNPDGSTVDVYFSTVTIFNAALWYLLPYKLKSITAASVTIVQSKTLSSNYKNGTGICGIQSVHM